MDQHGRSWSITFNEKAFILRWAHLDWAYNNTITSAYKLHSDNDYAPIFSSRQSHPNVNHFLYCFLKRLVSIIKKEKDTHALPFINKEGTEYTHKGRVWFGGAKMEVVNSTIRFKVELP